VLCFFHQQKKTEAPASAFRKWIPVIRMSAHMYQRCFRLAAVIHETDQFVQKILNIHPPAVVLSVPCPILTAQHLATSAHSSELIHHVLCLYYSISFHVLQVLCCAIIHSDKRMNTGKTVFTLRSSLPHWRWN
jgi:hypothetical protein